jgi:hypothetical protein
MKSKFKNLLVSGASFVHELHNEWYPFAWPSMLAETTGMKVHNLAIPGSGNEHLCKSIMLYLEKNDLTPQDTFVLPMWGPILSIDWVTDISLSNFRDEYPFYYSYDKFNELSLGGHWWNINKKTFLKQTMIDYSKFQSDHSFVLNSWMSMTNLTNYLKTNGYTYFCTSYKNYKNLNAVIPDDPLNVDFFTALDALGLTLDTNDWLPLADDDYYGDWAAKRGFLDPNDNIHPKYPKAPEGWVSQVLIPHLKDKGILYE